MHWVNSLLWGTDSDTLYARITQYRVVQEGNKVIVCLFSNIRVLAWIRPSWSTEQTKMIEDLQNCLPVCLGRLTHRHKIMGWCLWILRVPRGHLKQCK